MLGKTANGLFWLSRYLERAENTARLIETGQRLALTRLNSSDEEWRSVLQSAGAWSGFEGSGKALTGDAAIDWMLRDSHNAASIRCSIQTARKNARLVRTAITGEVWEAINATYMATERMLARKVSERDLPEVLRHIRQSTALVRGMVHGTMMRNDNYDFLRIGTFLERADNTARILDVKYYVLLPSIGAVGSSIDNVQWETILRSVSASGGFRMEHGASGGSAQAIADFLIVDKRMPRSLAFCVSKIDDNLRYLNGSTKPMECQKQVRHLQQAYLSYQVPEIFDYGLHEFLQQVLSQLSLVANQIETDFRFYE